MQEHKIAGVDVGNTFTKACWEEVNHFRCISTADLTLGQLREELRSAGITKLHLSGIGDASRVSEGFETTRSELSAIEAEITLQAQGVKILRGPEADQNFLLVSIGTGASFTFVQGDTYQRFPIGSARAGRTLQCRAALMGVTDMEMFARLAGQGTHLDLLVKDACPDLAGTPEGELVLAFFGKAEANSRRADLAASEVHDVAVSIVKDIMLMESMSHALPFEEVVYIGSTVGRLPKLQEYLAEWTQKIGKRAQFHRKGEYALAIGAYHWKE